MVVLVSISPNIFSRTVGLPQYSVLQVTQRIFLALVFFLVFLLLPFFCLRAL